MGEECQKVMKKGCWLTVSGGGITDEG